LVSRAACSTSLSTTSISAWRVFSAEAAGEGAVVVLIQA